MRRGLLLLFVITWLVSTGFVRQQTASVAIKNMEVSIWPEYDQPGVLVIYRLQLSAHTKLPVKVSLRIPREAGVPYKVAMKDLDGSIYNLEYSLIPEGNWNRISVTTLSSDMQIEYYDPRLNISDDQRNYEFSWICDYPIETLTISVQQPRGAYNLTISPYFGFGALNPVDKLVYYSTTVGKIETGITFSLSINYTKAGNELSASSLPVIAATPIPDNSGFIGQVAKLLIPALENQSLVLVGFFMAGALILMLVVSTLASTRTIKLPSITRNPKQPQTEKVVEEPEKYCSNCGKSVKPGDKFCRVCGSRIP